MENKLTQINPRFYQLTEEFSHQSILHRPGDYLTDYAIEVFEQTGDRYQLVQHIARDFMTFMVIEKKTIQLPLMNEAGPTFYLCNEPAAKDMQRFLEGSNGAAYNMAILNPEYKGFLKFIKALR